VPAGPATSGCITMAALHRPQEAPVIAGVAIARELASWCWSLAVMDD